MKIKELIFLTLIVFVSILPLKAEINLGTTLKKIHGNNVNSNIYVIKKEIDPPVGSFIKGETVSFTEASRFFGNCRIESSNLLFNPGHIWDHKFFGSIGGNIVITNGSMLQIKWSDKKRRNMLISELSNKSSIKAVNNFGLNYNGLFVYTEPGAVLTNCRFDGIKNVEVKGPFKSFYNVTFYKTQLVMLNWSGERIDRFGINVESSTSGWESWLGIGNGGNNSFYDWNPKKINMYGILHDHVNSKYFKGYTASYKFVDNLSDKAIEGVHVVYSDDRTDIGGDKQFQAEYITNTDGVLTGTVNTRIMEEGENKIRPTIYFLTHKSRITSGKVRTAFSIEPLYAKNYVIDSISISLVVKSYLHKKRSSNFSIDHEYGDINKEKDVVEYFKYYLKRDENISEVDKSKVLSYDTLRNLNDLYDMSKAKWQDNVGYPTLLTDGGIITLPKGWNLVVDGSASKVYSVNGTTITINSKFLDKSDKFSRINADNGTISFVNGGYINSIYTDKNRDAYVRLIYISSTDRIEVEDDNDIIYNRKGLGGYAYNSSGVTQEVKMISDNGIEAMMYYEPKPGTENTFFINFTASQNLFKVEDRIKVYENSGKIYKTIEDNNSLLHKIKLKLDTLNKELQHLPKQKY